jgi:hypothetical protein
VLQIIEYTYAGIQLSNVRAHDDKIQTASPLHAVWATTCIRPIQERDNPLTPIWRNCKRVEGETAQPSSYRGCRLAKGEGAHPSSYRGYRLAKGEIVHPSSYRGCRLAKGEGAQPSSYRGYRLAKGECTSLHLQGLQAC